MLTIIQFYQKHKLTSGTEPLRTFERSLKTCSVLADKCERNSCGQSDRNIWWKKFFVFPEAKCLACEQILIAGAHTVSGQAVLALNECEHCHSFT